MKIILIVVFLPVVLLGFIFETIRSFFEAGRTISNQFVSYAMDKGRKEAK